MGSGGAPERNIREEQGGAGFRNQQETLTRRPRNPPANASIICFHLESIMQGFYPGFPRNSHLMQEE